MIIIVNRQIIIIIEKSIIVPLLSWLDFSELFSQDTCLLLHMIDQCYMHMFHKTFIFKKKSTRRLILKSLILLFNLILQKY